MCEVYHYKKWVFVIRNVSMSNVCQYSSISLDALRVSAAFVELAVAFVCCCLSRFSWRYNGGNESIPMMIKMVIDDDDDDEYLSTDVKWLDPSPWEESVKHNEQNVLAWWISTSISAMKKFLCLSKNKLKLSGSASNNNFNFCHQKYFSFTFCKKIKFPITFWY